MADIVILTNSQLRHEFIRKAISLGDDITVLRSYCESSEGRIIDRTNKEGSEIKLNHLRARRQSEEDFFRHFVELAPDKSNPTFIPAGGINEPEHAEEISELNPDFLVAYGCSIVRDPLLSLFEDRILNVHLGLSPYYRGSGTNFWPLVNCEPEYVGATFMYMDEGIDTGEIIHQIRARVHPGDGPHQIGNRLILDMVFDYIDIIRNFDELPRIEQSLSPDESKYYERDDYSEEATEQLYANFESGLVERYLEEQKERIRDVPILENPLFD
jgi:hypothetical protein